jgi:hypothetical protein
MPDHCALYVSRRQPVSAELVARLAPDARVAAPGGPAGWARLSVAWPDVRLELSRMALGEPGFADHVAGFCGYVQRLAGEMDARTWELLQKAARTHQVIGVTASPGFDGAGKCRAMLLAVVAEHRGLLFRDSGLYDPSDRLLLGPGAAFDAEAALPVEDSALARKQASGARLRRLGVPILETLPALAGDEEARLRDPEDVARRAVALWAVTGRGLGALDGPETADYLRDRGVWDALSPAEQKLLGDPGPDHPALLDAGWRAEAMAMMFWALGHLDELPPPSEQCDPDPLAATLGEASLGEFIAGAHLRPVPEVLDELDFTYRLHWAVKEATLASQDPPAGALPGVAYQRHYALNWLTCYLDQDWDEVSADT